MAVNLSPIWGAGAQLLDNSGNVLSGGKIYTYAAGTTTQVATYTSNSGITANSNPIVLNSAGRVPYEIWLTDGQNYKFVLKDSNDVLIGTWDNLSGINSNFVNYTNQQEIQTATAGQTVFNLTTMQYLPGTGNLSVFVDGVNQYGPGAQYAFEETDQTTVTFASGLHVGASVKFTSTQIQNAGVTDASQISYTYPDPDAVTQNVEERLAQYVSVKDFGAVGDGVTDDTVSIQKAFDSGHSIKLVEGNYVASNLTITNKNCSVFGDGMFASKIIQKAGATGALITINQTCSLVTLSNFGLYDETSLAPSSTIGITVEEGNNINPTYPFGNDKDVRRDMYLDNVYIQGFGSYGLHIGPVNFSLSTNGLFIRNIYGTGAYVHTTDFTWINTQIDTCYGHCLHLYQTGNARFIGGKFIWSAWNNADTTIAGIYMDGCYNLSFAGVEAQDCGFTGIYIKDSFVTFDGLNTNRNSINADKQYPNITFENSTAVINTFTGKNYAAVDYTSQKPSQSRNFNFIGYNSVKIEGIIEAGVNSQYLEGDNNVMASTLSDVVINSLWNYASGLPFTPTANVPVYAAIAGSPTWVSAPSGISNTQALQLTQSNKDRLVFPVYVPSRGCTVNAVFAPTLSTGDNTIVYLGNGYGSGNASVILQFNVSSGGVQTINLLISGSDGEQVISSILSGNKLLQANKAYSFALGATTDAIWWSCISIDTGVVSQRFVDSSVLTKNYSALFNGTSGIQVFGGPTNPDTACEGKGACVYIGNYSAPTDYMASRYYSLYDGVDPSKHISMQYLNGSL